MNTFHSSIVPPVLTACYACVRMIAGFAPIHKVSPSTRNFRVMRSFVLEIESLCAQCLILLHATLMLQTVAVTYHWRTRRKKRALLHEANYEKR